MEISKKEIIKVNGNSGGDKYNRILKFTGEEECNRFELAEKSVNLKIDDLFWRTEFKKRRKINRTSEVCGTPSSIPTYMSWEYQMEWKERKEIEKVFEEIIATDSPNLMKNINLHIQETQQTPRKTQRDLCLRMSYLNY